MSDVDVGYSGFRLSQKQEKMYRATSLIAKLKKETAAILHPKVIGSSLIEEFHGVKEILHGVTMPARKK